MNYLSLINNVPDVYVTESRDFQLLLRVYECLFNSLRYDSNSITSVTDTMTIRNTLLPLLATKLGFISDKTQTMDDKALRLILAAYPIIVKNKGSMKALKQIVNLYFKIINSGSSYILTYVNQDTIIDNRQVRDHSVSIGVDSNLIDPSLLSLISSYILPAGILLDTYSFASFDTQYTLLLNNDAITILEAISSSHSVLRTSETQYDSDSSYGYSSEQDSQVAIIDAKNKSYGSIDNTEIVGRND